MWKSHVSRVALELLIYFELVYAKRRRAISIHF